MRRLNYDMYGPIRAMWSGPADVEDGGGGTEPALAADLVINRLFAISLTLASATSLVHDPVASGRLMEAIDGIDALIRDVRQDALFQADSRPASVDLRQSLNHVVNLADAAQADGSTTAELLDLAYSVRRALLQLDSADPPEVLGDDVGQPVGEGG
jgi:hypothetical protein